MRDEFLTQLEISGTLVAKRCTQAYLESHGLLQTLNQLVPESFGSISERIRKAKYGGGYCLVCGTRTKVHVSGSGFGKYCSEHFHQPKKNKAAHNAKSVDLESAKERYLAGESLNTISKTIGVSNVTLKAKLVSEGFSFRSHQECQQLHAKPGIVKPRIIIDREELRTLYVVDKQPVVSIAEKFNCHPETIRRFLIQEGIERTNRRSYIEQAIIDMLDRHSIEYRTNVKNLIYPYEIDIYIPKHNLAIELNGLYYHSFYRGNKNAAYHYMKYEMSKAAGVRLIQFWENDIANIPHIIESMILNRCGLHTTKIGARKCDVLPIDYHTLKTFCQDNHIQGACGKNSKGMGLFHKGNLVSVIGYVEGKEYVITRFCSLLGHNVMGAFSKLCNSLDINKSIRTYSSNDISDGDLYRNTGFTLVAESKSDLWYTDYDQVFNRQKYMKGKLHTMLDNFDENLTELNNMINNGYDAIYKSGTKTWLKSI